MQAYAADYLAESYAYAREDAPDETDLPPSHPPGGVPVDGGPGAGHGLLAGGPGSMSENRRRWRLHTRLMLATDGASVVNGILQREKFDGL
jgi:hypothetical protein